MSKPGKPAVANDAAAAGVPFEEALQKLTTIVEAMEGDDLPLEKLLASYEEGMRLHQICQSRLAAAETRIAQIEADAAGKLVAKPLELADNTPKL